MKRVVGLLLLVAAVVGGCASRRPLSVVNPIVEGNNTGAMTVKSVDLTDSTTVLNLNVKYRPKHWIKVASTAAIQADGKTYPLIGSEGMTPDSLFWMPESGEADFSLIFPSVPAKTKSIDFIETPEKGGWHIWGIDLRGRKSPQWLADVPAELRNRKFSFDGNLPPVPMGVDSTRIDVRIVGWREGMPSSLTFYFWSMGLQDQYEMEMELDSLGRGSLNVWTPGLTKMVTYRGRNAKMINLVPGEDITLWMPPVGNTEIYSNGSLAEVSEAFETLPDDIIGGEYPKFDYRMTHDEYADELFRLYYASKKNIEANAKNPMQRQIAMLTLQNGMLFLADANSQLSGDIARRFGWEAAEKGLYVDSLKFESLEPAVISRISDLFDTASPDLMWVNEGDYSSLGISTADILYKDSPFPARMKTIRELNNKMMTSETLPIPMDTIKSWGPFFEKVATDLLAQAKTQRLKIAKDMVSEAPDVPAEEVFDAIIAPHKGKVVMVDIWNTWCGPCRAAIKENEPLKTGEFADKDIVWIYIADESSPYVKYLSMIPDIKGLHYRLTSEQWRTITKRFQIDGIPYYILVDRDGNATGRPDLRDHSLYVSELKKALE